MPIQLVDGKEIEVDEKGQPVPVEPAAPVAPVEPVAPVAPAPAAPVAPVSPDPAPSTVPLPALHEERHRRQDAERELAEANRRLDEYTRLQQEALYQRRVQPVDYSSVNTFEELGRQFEERINLENVATKTALSREIGLLRYTDFDEVLTESNVLNDMHNDPVLARYLAAQPLPAIAAYQIGLARIAPKRVAAAKAAGEAAGAKKVADQIIKAAEAPVTLANAPGASSPAPVGLTLDKAADMSEVEWAALPPETRERLLRGERI